jgi:2,3-bisphosphoglycerate-independent phosphoglycerate mutase
MKLLLKSCFGSIDSDGHLAARDIRDKDYEYLAEVIDGIEIDHVRFDAKAAADLEITMTGENLSPMVTPNYIEKVNVVKQIVHRSAEAKFTASVLNKFIRKTNKTLGREPCNREKRTPPNIILIKEIEEV